MKIQDQMKRTLDGSPDLNLVAFGDLSSGLILNWCSKAPTPREVVDLLGEKAAACFALLGPEALLPEADRATFGASVIHFTERGSHIFARLPANADDVICAVCEPGARLAPLLQSTIALAEKIAETQ